jgi:hypothetical protein
MTLYNVDFFDRKMNYVCHDTIDTPDIDMDYLSPEASEITILQTNDIPAKGIVYIEGMDGFLGIIDNVRQGLGETTVSFKPFITIFDQAVRFYTKSQGVTTVELEETIGGLINSYFGASSYTGDEQQSLPITVVKTSSTKGWTLDIAPDKDDGSYCICNLYSAILQQALTKYRVAVSATANPNAKTITVTIGASPAKHTIEANMAGISVVDFTVDQMDNETNKLEIWNASNYTTKINYYLYKDGTYDTSGTASGKERITPVKMEVLSVTPSSSKTWAKQHKEQADQKFGDLKWKNHIELDVLPTNSTVLTWVDSNGVRHPLEMGQEAQIFYNGQFYDSILTGIKYEDLTTLIFGRIRVDMSKKNKLKTSQEYIDAKTVTKNSYTSKK